MIKEKTRRMLQQADTDLAQAEKAAVCLEQTIPVLQRLIAFYESPLWLQLHDEDLNFACLSEDGIWNALQDLLENARDIALLIDKSSSIE